jgi:hypothetical protein
MTKGWQVVLAFIVVWLFGGVIGGVAMLQFVNRTPAEKPLPPPEQFSEQLMRRWLINNQLNVTPQQRMKIRLIIQDTSEDMVRLHRENQHSGVLILENMQDQIAAVLNPAQRSKFYDLIQSQRERFRNFQQRQQDQMQRNRAGDQPGNNP